MTTHPSKPSAQGGQSSSPVSLDEIPLVILPDGVDIESVVRIEKEIQARARAAEQAKARAAEEAKVKAAEEQRARAAKQARAAKLAKAKAEQEAKAKAEAKKRRRRRRRPVEAVDIDVEQEVEREIQEGEGALFAKPYLAIACATVALLLLLFAVGWSYYVLPAAARPFHHLHAVLRPAGTIGLTLGILGTVLMVVSLAYLIRKSAASWARWGSLRSWMGFHIFTGLIGPALVLFHTSFSAHSALGILALSSLAIVVGSGMLGRYFYAHVPRTLEGRELEFEGVRQRLKVYRKKLIELGMNPTLLRIDEPTKKDRAPWLILAFIRVIMGDRQSKREFQRLHEAVCADKKLRKRTGRILQLVERLCTERQWLVRYQELHKIVSAWRFFHRWLAIVMLAAILFHILIAVNFGGLWILGGRN